MMTSETWLQVAENLPQGHKTRHDCPECGAGTNTNAAIVNHSHKGYSLYCNACGHNPFKGKGTLSLAQLADIKALNEKASTPQVLSIPPDFQLSIPLKGRLWLYKAGITQERWEDCGIGYSPALQRVVLPVYRDGKLVWFQSRGIHKEQSPKYIQPSLPKKGATFELHADSALDAGIVIIVEDILSAIRIGVQFNTVCILGTKLSDEQIRRLRKFTKVITWLDGDRAGREGSAVIRKTLGLIKKVGNIKTEKDPKSYSNKQIKQFVEAAVARM